MDEITIEELDINDKLKFIINYCDMYIEYCHNENLSINGDLTAEIYDNIYILEDSMQDNTRLNKDDVEELMESLSDIKEQLLTINDIDLFNHVHIIFEYTVNETINVLKKKNMK